ncbi:hypothetical protein D6D25_04238 [Aureobasidium pullulans]|nr:hypothetical protein D6D25_04238 [Aureobasidium pullulans]
MTGIDVESVKSPREITDLSRQLRAKYFNGIACNYLSYGMGGPADNIERLCLDIYRYIAQWYKQETEIWLFGLGRGAYALRCVVGMINNCGIVKDPNDDLCNLVHRTYLSPCKNDKPSSAQSIDFRKRASWDVVTPIKLLVLLDTLGTIDPDTTGYATKSPTLRDEVIPSTSYAGFYGSLPESFVLRASFRTFIGRSPSSRSQFEQPPRALDLAMRMDLQEHSSTRRSAECSVGSLWCLELPRKPHLSCH